MDDHLTRHVPIDPAEIHWARQRPPQHRTPLPRPGDTVRYRHHEWDAGVHDARLIEYVDTDDYGDALMWRYVLDERAPDRAPVVDGAGRRLMEPVDDPWPLVLLDTPFGQVITREARVRGSAGWLPCDWTTRWRPTPQALAVSAMPIPPERGWSR